MSKPWIPLTETSVDGLGGYTGVYQLAGRDGSVVRIGYAGGRSRYGLRGELQSALGTAELFRFEVTTAYMTRYQELLMVHMHDHGRLPPGNDEDPAGLGRMSPA